MLISVFLKKKGKLCLEIQLLPYIDFQDDDDDDAGLTPWTDRATDQKLANVNLRQTAIDITAEDLAPRLNATNVADLVLISMVNNAYDLEG